MPHPTHPIRFDSVDRLFDPESLSEILESGGPVEIIALETLGYSGSTFWHVRSGVEKYFIKRTDLSEDWFSFRTRDETGREAAVLVAPESGALDSLFDLPYRAVAMEGGVTA